jgi:hypothetical protein
MHAWHVIRASEIKTMYVVKGDDRVVRRARLQKASRTCMGWGGRGGCLLAWPCMHRQREQGLVVWPTVADEVVRRGAGAGAGLLWSTGTWVVVTMLKCVRALRFRFGSMCVKRKRSTNNHSPKDACLFPYKVSRHDCLVEPRSKAYSSFPSHATTQYYNQPKSARGVHLSADECEAHGGCPQKARS